MGLILASSYSFISYSIVFLFLYMLYGAIYRLYFSPVAKFPGPRLAALTFWYEFYYDVIKRGLYTFKIIELHKQYGAWHLNLHSQPHCWQVLLYASIPTNSTLTNPTSMTKSAPALQREPINGTGL